MAKAENGRPAGLTWREAFDAVERPIARASEAWLETDTFMDALAATWRIQRRMRREVERGTAAWLHLWGIPSRGDVKDVANQVGRLERQVRQLARERQDTS